MGLFGFLKKKTPGGAIKQPKPPQGFDSKALNTDLPSIDGSSLPPLTEMPELSPLPPIDTNALYNNLNPLPAGPQDNSVSSVNKGDGGMIVHIAPMDFSMPESDDATMLRQGSAASTSKPKNDLANSSMGNLANDDIEDDLNRLFLSDDQWKEPDWSNFDPYVLPEIDEPVQKDFGLETYDNSQEENIQAEPAPVHEASDLPGFIDEENPEQPMQIERPKREVPFELFVKGSHYRNVFSELSRINELLNMENPRLSAIEAYSKQEDDALNKAKDNMEYIYKKLMYVDKRVFS